MLVTSEKYPSLHVCDLGLRFKDGKAEVTDPAALKRLRSLAHMGVVVPDGGEPAAPDDATDDGGEPAAPKRRPGRPRKNQSE